MTEAERIEFVKSIEMDAAKANWHYQGESYKAFENGYIAGATAENERLQQLIKEKDESREEWKKVVDEIYPQLKSAQELNRELVEAVEGLSRYESAKEFDKLQELIKKAKCLNTPQSSQ